MKPGIQMTYLWTDTQTYKKDPRGALPWAFDKTRELFKFPKGSNSYPKDGILNLPRECDDYQGIIETDADWMALRQFYARIEALTQYNKKSLIALQRAKDNSVWEGWKLYKRYFDRLYTRSKLRNAVDVVLTAKSEMPHNVYQSKGMGADWPPEKQVSGKSCARPVDKTEYYQGCQR